MTQGRTRSVLLSANATESLRRHHLFLKSVAVIVTTAFLGLTLQPLAIAAKLPSAPPKTPVSAAPPSNEARLSRELDAIQTHLDRLDTKITKHQDTTTERKELKALRADLDQRDREALADFEKIGKHIKDKHLPAIIQQRQDQAVKQYKAEMAALKANLENIDNAKNDTARKAQVTKARDHLKGKRHRARPKIDPNNLPTRALKPNRANKPKLQKSQFHLAGLYDNPTVKVAALGDFTFDKLPGASDPAYLAATPEVVLSDAIKAKAAELEYDPVKIYNWVYANTNWLPTWGAIQNSNTVLLTQKGNAFDLSALLIALLRASGIPSRYVHGTIEIPADKFMNWAGGFTDPNGAWDLASAAGIPITAVTSGGKVVAFRMEHVWVEAAIDFFPSRGAVNKAADSWVQLDPSFKQYETERGYDMYSRLNFDGEQFLMDYIQNGTDKTPYQYYSKEVLEYLDTNMPDWTLEDLYGHERVSSLKPTIGGNLRVLAASLPYKTITRGYTAATIPDSLRHKVTVEVATSAALGSDATYTVALTELAQQRLTLSFIPASSADDAVVDDYGSLFASPAYLVYVKPVLRKGGVVVATGNATALGEKQTLTLSFQSPTLSSAPIANQITAGSYSAIVFQGMDAAIDVPGGAMQQLMTNAELNEQNLANMDDLLGQLLHNIGTMWFFDLKYERDFYATTTQVTYTQLPSETIATADLTVSYFMGIPRSVTEGFFTVDADRDAMAAAPISGEARRIKDFMLISGMTGSSWEHLVFEGFFSVPGVSSMKLLRAASDQMVPVYTIDGNNIAQVLPTLALSGEDVADIQNGVNAGKKVVVSQAEVQVGSYRGVGLLILDPANGDGLYLIGGGLSGGAVTQKTIGEWKTGGYTKKYVALLMRALVMMYASALIGTPYGFGCKNPIQSTPMPLPDGSVLCADKSDPNKGKFGIDCSGLVQFSYHMAGFPYFTGYSAEGQYKIAGQFGCYPDAPSVLPADLIFFDRTYDKNEPKQSKMDPPQKPGPEDLLTHVGLTLRFDLWIAAEGKRVGRYTFRPGMDTTMLHGYGSIFSSSCGTQ